MALFIHLTCEVLCVPVVSVLLSAASFGSRGVFSKKCSPKCSVVSMNSVPFNTCIICCMEGEVLGVAGTVWTGCGMYGWTHRKMSKVAAVDVVIFAQQCRECVERRLER